MYDLTDDLYSKRTWTIIDLNCTRPDPGPTPEVWLSDSHPTRNWPRSVPDLNDLFARSNRNGPLFHWFWFDGSFVLPKLLFQCFIPEIWEGRGRVYKDYLGKEERFGQCLVGVMKECIFFLSWLAEGCFVSKSTRWNIHRNFFENKVDFEYNKMKRAQWVCSPIFAM